MKLNPDHQFAPNEANVKSILELYGLALKQLTPATSGIENTTLIITTSTGKFVLRIYRQHSKDLERIEQEINFVDYLNKKGIKVPAIVPNIKNENITEVEIDGVNWQTILMEFVEGSHAMAYTEPLLQDMADAQSRMHLLSTGFNDNSSESIIRELKESVFIKLIDKSRITEPRLIEFLARAESYQKTLEPKLPAGLCHLDYDRENILADKHGNIKAILDFDDLASAPFVLDLGYTLWEIWYTNGKETAKRYLTLYEQNRPLSDLEKSFLMPVILFRHYVICSADVVRGQNDESSIDKNLKLEAEMNQVNF